MSDSVYRFTAIFIALFFVGSIPAQAKRKAPVPQADVRTKADLCTQTAPSGKAKVTELAQGKNVFMARLEMQPHAKVAEHRDATEEYIHIVTGTGKIFIEGKEYPVAPGTTIFMPAKAKVRFENGPDVLVGIQVFAGPGPATKYKSWGECKK